jgi:hypothetical protein
MWVNAFLISFSGVFLKSIEKNHYIAFIENEKYTVNVAVVLHTEFKPPSGRD